MSHATADEPTEWEIVERKTAYRGFFSLDVLKLRHRLFSGGWSEIITRELFRMRQAVTVLPFDPSTQRVVLVEQFRTGMLESGARPWILEAPAGLAEPGEALEEVARRECHEETGLTLGRLVRACDYAASPGACSEQVRVFIGELTELPRTGVSGQAGEGEDIRSHVVDLDEAIRMVGDGRIIGISAIVAILWLGANHEQLALGWAAGKT